VTQLRRCPFGTQSLRTCTRHVDFGLASATTPSVCLPMVQSSVADPGVGQASQGRRRRRRDLRCPSHPDQLLRSVSVKRYLAETPNGDFKAGPVQRERFLVWARRQGLTPLPGDWIEAFHCPACNAVLQWRVKRDSAGDIGLLPLPEGVVAQLQQRSQHH
jgi:hypothetical protein